MKLLNKQDINDIVFGAAILGTGGGGSLEQGLKLVNRAVDDQCDFYLASFDEFNGDDLVGTPYSCGAISSLTNEQQKEYDELPKTEENSEITAIRTIEKFLGKKMVGVVTTELGGGNTANALEAAARLGLPIIDADPAGRSVPGLQHTTYNLANIPIHPMGVANNFGESMIITNTVSDERAEKLTRAAAIASFNHVGVVDHIGKWKDIKKGLIPNTISLCLEVGKIARESRENNKNIAEEIISNFNGYLLFKGIVEKAKWETKDGFTFGEVLINGKADYSGDTFKIWIQNENIISWLNGKIYVTVPDSINLVDDKKNMPLLNPDAKEGDQVTIFGLKALEPWRTQKGLEVFGPRSFGYDVEYRPIEEII